MASYLRIEKRGIDSAPSTAPMSTFDSPKAARPGGARLSRGRPQMENVMVTGFVASSRLQSPNRPPTLLVAIAGVLSLLAGGAFAEEPYFRLQLKQGQRYLDAVNCSDRVALNAGSTYANGACQLWRLVPAGGGWSRLQLKQSAKFLDAVNCSDQVGLHPGSTYAGGACQLWRVVSAGDGWYRLQLKQGGQYLDAVNCSDNVAMNPGSDYAGGACQLWRFVHSPAPANAPSPMLPPPPAPSVSPVPRPAPAPAPEPQVVKVDEGCHQYAYRAVQQFKVTQGRAGCATNSPPGRWQGNYEAHYGWCVKVSDNARGAEQAARDRWLTSCGAQHKID